MKKFFKKNWLILLFFFIGFILFVLGMLFEIFLLIACLIFGVLFFIIATRLRRKQKDDLDYSYEDDYFDATQLDYDEEIYYIGDPNKQRKEVGKSVFKKLAFSAPVIFLYLLAIGFLSMSVLSVLRLFV